MERAVFFFILFPTSFWYILNQTSSLMIHLLHHKVYNTEIYFSWHSSSWISANRSQPCQKSQWQPSAECYGRTCRRSHECRQVFCRMSRRQFFGRKVEVMSEPLRSGWQSMTVMLFMPRDGCTCFLLSSNGRDWPSAIMALNARDNLAKRIGWDVSLNHNARIFKKAIPGKR